MNAEPKRDQDRPGQLWPGIITVLILRVRPLFGSKAAIHPPSGTAAVELVAHRRVEQGTMYDH